MTEAVNGREDLTIIDLRELGFTHAFLVGHHAPHKPVRALRHLHPGIFEIQVVADGQVSYVIGEERHEIHAGQAFLIQPDVVHGTSDEPLVKCERYWFQIRKPSEGGAVLGLSAEETRDLFEKLEATPTCTYSGGAGLIATFEKLLEAIDHGGKSALDKLYLKHCMQGLLLDFLAMTQTQTPVFNSPGIKKSLAHIREAVGSVSLDELAEVAGMSTSTFVLKFREEMGFSPLEFAMRVRIDKARQMLLSTARTVTEIAHELEFATSQHFATVFRKYTGMTPSEYRKGIVLSQNQEKPVAITDPAMKPLE